MKTYTIVKKQGDLDWSKVPVATLEPIVQEGLSLDIEASAQLCYDDENLYVHLSAKENPIRAEHTGPLDSVCEDSCLEFFFSPMYGDDRYFNIEYNPNGCVYLGFAENLQKLIRLVPEFGIPFDPKVEMTEDGWNITYHIPYEFVRRFYPEFNPTSGTKMRGNFYKCADLSPKVHYLWWNPMSLEPLSYHKPKEFGEFIFE